MPELPEVETMVERLQKFVGYGIIAADSRDARCIPGNEQAFVTGQTIKGIFRRGKFIIFMLDRGAILCHNAMSGFWDWESERWTFDYVEGKRQSSDTDIRALLHVGKWGEPIAGSTENLLYHDARKFGYMKYLEPEELTKKLSTVGPEADHTANLYEPTEVIDENKFFHICNNKRVIKEVLMDQSKIAGVGNIYAAEALWKAGISPFRVAHTLDVSERLSLFLSTRSVIRQAIERRLDYSGLKVYRRDLCPTCNKFINADKIKGRTTYWCSTCQR